jgi:hypothetical protein
LSAATRTMFVAVIARGVIAAVVVAVVDASA